MGLVVNLVDMEKLNILICIMIMLSHFGMNCHPSFYLSPLKSLRSFRHVQVYATIWKTSFCFTLILGCHHS